MPDRIDGTGLRLRLRQLLAGVLVLLLSISAAADLIWEVRGEDGVFLLGGTLHVLRPEDFPLPAEFEQAYRASDQLVLEADPGGVADPAVQQLVQEEGFMGADASVEQVLAAGTWRRVVGFALARELDLSSLQQLRPAMLAITLTNIELARLGVTEVGVDGYFYQRARADGLPMGELETAAAQVRMLLGLGEEDPDGYLLATLEELERAQALLVDAIRIWREGRYEALYEHMVRPLREDHPLSYDTLFVARHEAWLPQLEALAESPTRELVLVGAGHLGGPHGLLHQLQEAGLAVAPWTGDQRNAD